MFEIENNNLLTKEMDKALINRATNEVTMNYDWVIRPLIFDAESSSPVITPILSALTFNTISDSSLEIIDQSISDDINESIKDQVYKTLNNDACNNILYTIINNIIESSTLTFNAWWESMHNKYLILNNEDKSLLNFIADRQPPALFYNYIRDNDYKYNSILTKSIQNFISNTLKFKYYDKLLNDPVKIKSNDPYNKDYMMYLEFTAINISNFITVVFVDAITNYLFKNISLSIKCINDIICESSDLINSMNKDEDINRKNFIHTSIEYILEDSLYDVILSCIKPSIVNILESSIGSFFYVFSDMSRIDKNKQIEE